MILAVYAKGREVVTTPPGLEAELAAFVVFFWCGGSILIGAQRRAGIGENSVRPRGTYIQAGLRISRRG